MHPVIERLVQAGTPQVHLSYRGGHGQSDIRLETRHPELNPEEQDSLRDYLAGLCIPEAHKQGGEGYILVNLPDLEVSHTHTTRTVEHKRYKLCSQ